MVAFLGLHGFFIGINGSKKSLEHPWTLSNTEKFIYSRNFFFMYNVLQNGSFRNCSLKGSFGKTKNMVLL